MANIAGLHHQGQLIFFLFKELLSLITIIIFKDKISLCYHETLHDDQAGLEFIDIPLLLPSEYLDQRCAPLYLALEEFVTFDHSVLTDNEFHCCNEIKVILFNSDPGRGHTV